MPALNEPKPHSQTSLAGMGLLSNRACLQITGEDRLSFLQGLLTNDVTKASAETAVFTGLLSPQGKILFDFFLIAAPDAFLIECDRASATDLLKRLSMYKLRANVALADVSETYRVGAAWGEIQPPPHAAFVYQDPRLEALGHRFVIPQESALALNASQEAAYHAYRIHLGVPESSKDYALGDTFPHEACYDLLSGVDFKKGCFVGQEVVSRMQHRGTARTRIVQVAGQHDLPQDGAPLLADGFEIGKLGSVAGQLGVGLARLDRAAEAIAKGAPIMASGVHVQLSAPSWVTYRLDAPSPSSDPH